MREPEFRDWLSKFDGRPARQIGDNISRVKRVEAAFDIDLDSANLDLVIAQLEPGSQHPNLPRDAAGMSSLKVAIRKYAKFRGGNHL